MAALKPYHWEVKRALTTPILSLGTEKPLLVLNVTLCLCFAFATHFSYQAFFAPVLFLLFHGICFRISKADPRMIAVFRRAKRYRGFFKALPSEHSPKPHPFNCYPKELDNVRNQVLL